MSDSDKQAFDKLASNVASYQSIEVTTREDFSCNDPNMAKKMTFHSIRTHYIETAKGQRLLEETCLEGSKVVSRFAYYNDGSQCADVQYQQDNPDSQSLIVIKRSFYGEGQSERVNRPIPLLYLYVGKRLLSKSADSAIYSGPTNIIGRQCDEWKFEQVKWFLPQDQIFSMDRKTGIPLKVVSFSNNEHRLENKPLFTWIADGLDVVDGHPIVRKSHYFNYNAESSTKAANSLESQSRPEILFAREYNIQDLEYNKNHPSSTFWPVIEPGVSILNTITNQQSIQPGRKLEIATHQELAKRSIPIIAHQPQDWSSTIAGTSLVLGLLVLIVGGYLWFKSRKTTRSHPA